MGYNRTMRCEWFADEFSMVLDWREDDSRHWKLMPRVMSDGVDWTPEIVFINRKTRRAASLVLADPASRDEAQAIVENWLDTTPAFLRQLSALFAHSWVHAAGAVVRGMSVVYGATRKRVHGVAAVVTADR